MEKQELKAGDVVQIDPEYDDVFGGSLMIVTEPQTWGAIGSIHVFPLAAGDKPAQARYHCKFKDMEYIGIATWMPPEGRIELPKIDTICPNCGPQEESQRILYKKNGKMRAMCQPCGNDWEINSNEMVI